MVYSKSVMNICIVFLNAQIESISNGMVKCKNTAFIFSDGTGDDLIYIGRMSSQFSEGIKS